MLYVERCQYDRYEKKLQNINVTQLTNIDSSDVESSITKDDCFSAMKRIKSSVAKNDLSRYQTRFQTYGSL